MPKTWSVVPVTRSPTKYKIRMEETEHPRHKQHDLPAEYETEEEAWKAIDDWKKADKKKG